MIRAVFNSYTILVECNVPLRSIFASTKLLEHAIDAPEADVELLVGDVPANILSSEMPLLLIAEKTTALSFAAQSPATRHFAVPR